MLPLIDSISINVIVQQIIKVSHLGLDNCIRFSLPGEDGRCCGYPRLCSLATQGHCRKLKRALSISLLFVGISAAFPATMLQLALLSVGLGMLLLCPVHANITNLIYCYSLIHCNGGHHYPC